MKAIDVNCLLGHWPFRKIRRASAGDLLRVHAGNGIGLGLVSSLDSIFYADPFEGELELHEQLRDTGYRHILTVNPALPAFEEDIRRGVARFNIAGVRIHPGIHGYTLDSPPARRLYGALRECRLPLFVSLRMEDERLHYLLRPQPVPVEDIGSLIGGERDLDIVLLTLRLGEITALREALRGSPRTLFDTSGLKDSLFTVEKVLDAVGDSQLVYGSQHPLFCLKSTLLEVTMAGIPAGSRDKILFGNAGRLLR